MPIRFYKRLTLMPGVRVNLSKRGLSVSLGERGAWLTVGSSGARATVGLPGTGLSYTEKINLDLSHGATGQPGNEPVAEPRGGRIGWGWRVVIGLIALAVFGGHG
jgi:hypothetical protein